MIQNYEKITKVLAKSLGISAEELVDNFQPATTEDLPAICELMRLGFGEVENLTSDIISWRYFNYSHNISDIFVLRYQGKLIGAVGAEPIKIALNTQEYTGIRTADIVVHPDHMARGIGAWMNLHLQSSFSIVMAMGANENSNSMVRRLFKPMNCRHHFKILFSVKRYFSVRNWPAILVNTIAIFAALPLTVIRRYYLISAPHDYQLCMEDNTEKLSAFFNHPEYQPRDAISTFRSADYCRWRYDLNPKSCFKVLQLQQQEQLLGYAIVKQNHNSRNKDWQLMDWDLLPTFRNEKHLRMLFSAAIKFSLRDGAYSLSVMASDPLSCASLLQSGFSHRALDDGFFLFADTNIDPQIFDESRWFLSLSDTDESL